MDTSTRTWGAWAQCGAIALLAACSGGGGGGSGGTGTAAGGATSFSLGGQVGGLPSGASVTLQLNGGEALVVAANGSFTFTTLLATGAAYRVAVSAQPQGALCSVAGGSGTVGTGNITGIGVGCTTTAAAGATTGSTALSALSAGDARVALVPLNLPRSVNAASGVLPVGIDGRTVVTGGPVATSFPIQSCSTDSVNLVAVCMNYSSATVALLDLSRFATSLNTADIAVREFDTGAPATLTTTFSGSPGCRLCGLVSVPALKAFVVAAYDGYRVYGYPAAGAASPLVPTRIYTVPVTENFALSNAHAWLVSPDYKTIGSNPRQLRVIDLAKGIAYTWIGVTNLCLSTDGPACTAFSSQEVDSVAFADDTGLLTMDSETGNAQMAVDMSRAVFDDASATFSAPYAYADLSVLDGSGLGYMAGLLASSLGHWGYAVAEYGNAVVGVQQMADSLPASGPVALPAPNPLYLDLSTLANHGACAAAPVGGVDPHAQGYTVTTAGNALGLFVSGDSRCLAVIDFAKFYAAPRQPGAMSHLVDTSNYDPVASGAVTFYALPGV
ncbi:MAG: hypothetical protein KGL50_01035 [Burkholderiales bacterium]|nr:hypothetical protein [Burkholderiales bacterium]